MSETWVVVADGARARILRVDRKARKLELVEELDHPPARRKTSEIVSDRQGRALDRSSVGQRSAMEPQTDPQRHEKAKLAQHIADRLAAALAAGGFERLVLVAAPQTLGDLRACLPDGVRGKVVEERTKDLTRLELPVLERHLEDLLPG